MARTIWGEARGEGQAGMEAVACVIVNRALNPGWGGRGVAGVCQAPSQFSCWNQGDPNRAKLLAVTSGNTQFDQCRGIAIRAMARAYPDPTNNADSYYDTSIRPPKWSIGKIPSAMIGKFHFFRLYLPAPATTVGGGDA